mgnify:CR=1 FL=1
MAVGGAVGLDVQLSAQGAGGLPAAGSPVRLWTHLAVREDHWSLYGFVDEEERAMFRLLISVSGVGPKVALGMLSKATPADIALFLRTGDEKSLTALPGIGKKSAARLVVELGNRVPEVPGSEPAAAATARESGPLGDALAHQGERLLETAGGKEPGGGDLLEGDHAVGLRFFEPLDHDADHLRNKTRRVMRPADVQRFAVLPKGERLAAIRDLDAAQDAARLLVIGARLDA